MEYPYKFVCYEKWCPKCEHQNVDPREEPCKDCYFYTVERQLKIPINFEEKGS